MSIFKYFGIFRISFRFFYEIVIFNLILFNSFLTETIKISIQQNNLVNYYKKANKMKQEIHQVTINGLVSIWDFLHL